MYKYINSVPFNHLINMKSFLTLADIWINTSWSCCGNKTLLLFYARKIPCTCAALWNNQRQKLSPCAQLFSQFHHILLSWRKFQGWTLLNDHFVVCWVLENHISVISLYFIATSLRVNTICSLLTKIRQKCNLDKSPSFQKYFSLWGNYGPDRLESTILKITCKISVVFYSLLFLDNSLLCQKIINFWLVILTNDWLFSDSSLLFSKITT